MIASLRITVLALFALSITTVAFAADAGDAGEDPLPPDAATSDAESDAQAQVDANSDAQVPWSDDVGPDTDVVDSDVVDSDVVDSDVVGSDVVDSDVVDSDVVDSDVVESDVVDPDPDTTEPPSGQFSESECWDEMCPEQINACKADANCSSYAGCIVNSLDDASAEACLTELQTTLGADPFQAASELYQKIAIDCGWSACATTEGSCAGNCGNYNGADVCNCDPQCWDFGDCCQDICDVCSAENAEACGTACVPDCAGKSCGDNGCGGSCGACMPGQSCEDDGTCAASCEDECTDGEVGCDGDSAWICGVNSLGCTAYSTIDCAGSGEVCSEGSCVDGAAGDATTGDTSGATVTEEKSGSGSSSGCGGAPSDGGPLGGLIASLLVLGLAIRRRA